MIYDLWPVSICLSTFSVVGLYLLISRQVFHCISLIYLLAVPFLSVYTGELLSWIVSHIRFVSIYTSICPDFEYGWYDCLEECMECFCFVFPLWCGFVHCCSSFLVTLYCCIYDRGSSIFLLNMNAFCWILHCFENFPLRRLSHPITTCSSINNVRLGSSSSSSSTS